MKKVHTRAPRPSARLSLCLDAGGLVALFPMLAHWGESELNALVEDADRHYQECAEVIKAVHQSEVFKPENFLSEARSKILDGALKKADAEAFGICVEISSVAIYYLEQIQQSAAKEPDDTP